MFEKLGNYQNISEIRKKAISETLENKNFGKKRRALAETVLDIWFKLI